jgi:C4-dicarboxylate transporter DctM subunit
MSNSGIIGIMTALFLGLGYLGVPVAFALAAGVIVGSLLTSITLQSVIGQMFNGIDSEAPMAIPFFLLVGELMTSANVVIRVAELCQALVGHMRGGLAQVTTVFSMFFYGMSDRPQRMSPYSAARWPNRCLRKDIRPRSSQL